MKPVPRSAWPKPTLKQHNVISETVAFVILITSDTTPKGQVPVEVFFTPHESLAKINSVINSYLSKQ